MTQYWWVNHKQTAKQEIEGQYLWSPKTNRNGARNPFYENMRHANPGDLVLSYANQVVAAIGRVTEFAFTAPKPSEFGSTGAYWLDEGWLLPVFWTPLEPPVRPKTFIDALRPLLPKKYSPIRATTGGGNQSVYLANVSRDVFEMVVAGASIDFALLLSGGANSLTFQAVRERLEDRVEHIVQADAALDTTTKASVIQARRGQGVFRSNVEKIERACRLTGITNPTLLIASHIRPWRSCETAQQRLDGTNGLLLTPDADLLFDRGFITFEDDGKVRVSPRFDRDDLRRLGLGESAWKQLGFSEAPMAWQEDTGFTSDQRRYLAYHRHEVYVS